MMDNRYVVDGSVLLFCFCCTYFITFHFTNVIVAVADKNLGFSYLKFEISQLNS